MNTNILLAENPNFKIVKVVFEGASRQYTYKTFLEVEAGDIVVVKTPSEGLKLVEAIEVIPADEADLNPGFTIKWLVDVVNRNHYRECKEREAQINKQMNTLRAKKQRKEATELLKEEYGAEAIEQMQSLVRL